MGLLRKRMWLKKLKILEEKLHILDLLIDDYVNSMKNKNEKTSNFYHLEEKNKEKIIIQQKIFKLKKKIKNIKWYNFF